MLTKGTRKILLLSVMVIVAGLMVACGATGEIEAASSSEITQDQALPPENTQVPAPATEIAQETEAQATVEESNVQPSEEASPETGELILVTVPAPSLANNLIGEVTEQTAAIYLPPSYQASDDRFPVVYYLPATNESPKNLYSGLMVELAMNRLLKEGKGREMILVVPNARNILGSTGVWVNSPVTGNWEDYVVEDLVPFVDANYRTLATPASRGIAGTVIGGFGAYNLAMHHPDVFGSVYTSSPTLFAPDGLEKSWIVDTLVRQRMTALMEEITALTPEAVNERLMRVASDGITPFGGTVSYAMAFVADVEAGTPYFDFEYIYLNDETKAPEEVWRRWANGYGGWDVKTVEFAENFAALNAIALSYSPVEQLYIREGTQFASEQLEAAGIDHELHIKEQGSTPMNEMLDMVLPFFSENLSFE